MAGRPKRVFSEEEKAKILQMALDNVHFETIALALEIPVNTLKRHFGRFITQKRAEGRVELAHVQREVAIKDKDRVMLIWRGKQDLDQTDKQTIKQEGGVVLDISPELMALAKKMATEYAKGAK